MRLLQNNPEACRRSLARITNAYFKGNMDEQTAKTLAYLLNVQLGYWKLIKDIEIEKRLDEIEAKLGGNR